MRYALILLATLALVLPARAQQEATPDTLDWRGYYPLDVGNIWETRTEVLVAYTAEERRMIIADTLLDGHRYFVQARYLHERDGASRLDRTRLDTLYLRYDTLRTVVVARAPAAEEEWDYTCQLGAAFNSGHFCEDWRTQVGVSGGYATESQPLMVRSEEVPYNAVKHYDSLSGGETFYHGVGYIGGIGDGAAGTLAFTYVRVGDQAYGERLVLASTDDGPAPDAAAPAVYPSPARDRITMTPGGLGPASLAVYDVRGRLVLRVAACPASGCAVDVRALAPGVYVVRRLGEGSARNPAAQSFVVAR